MPEMIDVLTTRRSVLAKYLTSPGPSESEIEQILQAAHRVPDHGKLGPWRFLVIQGQAREQLSHRFADIFTQKYDDCTPQAIEFERARLSRAPLVIAVVFSPKTSDKVPEWEQMLAVGAVCQNTLLAATALGYGSQWLTEWYSYNEDVGRLLKLQVNEKFAGFIYIGSYQQAPSERPRPPLAERVSRLSGI